MTALELYREDRQTRRDPAKRRSRQEYFILLRDALHEELAVEGRSEFLEEMIAGGGEKALPVLEFAALRECFAAIVDGRRMKDASQYVPHILRGADTPLTWADLEKGPALRVDDPQMPEMLVRLRNVSWQLVSARDQTPAVETERAVSREIAGLRAVNRALEEDNRTLREERDALLARVTQLEEGVITQQMQHKVDARRYQLDDELNREMAQKRRVAEEQMHASLAQAARAEQDARELTRREAAQEDARRAAAYDAMLEKVQTTLTQQLEDFQRTMREADHRFLAQSFAGLHGVISRETPLLLGEAPAQGASAQLLQRLADYSAMLNAQLTRMEQALLQLGLQVAQPAPGEPFDAAQHSPAAARSEDAPEGEREVAGVESPAVLRVQADGQTATLVRAVVHTRRNGETAETPGH